MSKLCPKIFVAYKTLDRNEKILFVRWIDATQKPHQIDKDIKEILNNFSSDSKRAVFFAFQIFAGIENFKMDSLETSDRSFR